MNTTDTLQSTMRAREYLDLWVQLISEYLSNLFRANVQAETVAAQESLRNTEEGSESGLWIRVAADTGAEQAFFLSTQDVVRLSQLLSGRQAGLSAEPNLDSRKAVVELFSQVAAKIPTADWLGFGTELKISESNRPEWESAFEAAFGFSTPQDSLLLLHARISAGLATALQSAQETGRAEKRAHPAISPHPWRAASETLRDNRLELLMDVELEVVLRFGQREMLLRDVLTLTPGTVLELDQQVQDPVELLVGNRVIAWGEVVAIDGNYGLRITSLASRKERLESLRK